MSNSAVLACSVRHCGRPLEPHGRALVCTRGHSFDVARAGYVNLLQPQDRCSLAAGDSPAAVAARVRLEQAGFGGALRRELLGTLAELGLAPGASVVELGSGTGRFLAELAARFPCAGTGIDLSVAASEHAARAWPGLTWIVANADRRLPLRERSVELLLSIHGRRNPAESARVLAPHGHLLVAVPGPEDLKELRAAVQGVAEERARVPGLLADLEPLFVLERRTSARERLSLARAALLDLLASTYRGGRRSERERVAALDRLTISCSSEILLLAPRADLSGEAPEQAQQRARGQRLQ
jgi:23S rRNA (guanine745-N1)-methyltransferase